MLKHVVSTFMACWICWGAILLIQAFEYNSKFQKSSDWSTTSGRVIREGCEPLIPRPISHRTYGLNIINLLFGRPYVHYSYVVNGEKYESIDKLPVVLAPVRTANQLAKRDNSKFEGPNAKNGWDLAAGSERSSKWRTTVRKKDGSKIEKVNIKSNQGVVTEIRRTDPNGVTTIERVEKRADGSVVKNNMNTVGSQDGALPDSGFEIPIAYHASEPEKGVPAKDMIGGFQALLNSALVSILVPLLVFGAMKMHSNVVKPSENDLINRYDLPSSIK